MSACCARLSVDSHRELEDVTQNTNSRGELLANFDLNSFLNSDLTDYLNNVFHSVAMRNRKRWLILRLYTSKSGRERKKLIDFVYSAELFSKICKEFILYKIDSAKSTSKIFVYIAFNCQNLISNQVPY